MIELNEKVTRQQSNKRNNLYLLYANKIAIKT